jgi:hypothetical protein
MGAVMCWGVLITVQFRKTLESAFLIIRNVHERELVQRDFEKFKSYELAGESEPGGFMAPEDQVSPPESNLVEVISTGGWGSLDRSVAAMEALDHERELLTEDFPDENRLS